VVAGHGETMVAVFAAGHCRRGWRAGGLEGLGSLAVTRSSALAGGFNGPGASVVGGLATILTALEDSEAFNGYPCIHSSSPLSRSPAAAGSAMSLTLSPCSPDDG
jgi:hypothetical protein